MITIHIYPLVLKGNTRDITCVQFNRDSDLLFSASRDGSISAWYTRDGERLGTYESTGGSINWIEISHDSKYMIAAGANMTLTLFDVASGKVISTIKTRSPVKYCGFLIGSETIVTCELHTRGRPACVCLYGIENEDGKVYIDPEPRLSHQHSLEDSGFSFVRAAVTDLNSTILILDNRGGLTRWNLPDGPVEAPIQLSKEPLTDIKLSNDRQMALITSRDSVARLIDANTLEIIKQYNTDRPLNCCAISPILNHVLLAGGQDKNDVTLSGSDAGRFEVQFWHVFYEELLTQVTGHFGPVNTMAMSYCGKFFVSGGDDGGARLYRLDDNYLKSTY